MCSTVSSPHDTFDHRRGSLIAHSTARVALVSLPPYLDVRRIPSVTAESVGTAMRSGTVAIRRLQNCAGSASSAGTVALASSTNAFPRPVKEWPASQSRVIQLLTEPRAWSSHFGVTTGFSCFLGLREKAQGEGAVRINPHRPQMVELAPDSS